MNFDDASIYLHQPQRVKTRQQMKGITHSIQKSKRKYCHISQEKKKLLISLVLEKKLRIKDAAVICNLNYSTAKTILYTLRHQPPKQAGFKLYSVKCKPKLTMKTLIKGTLIKEYDFYQCLNQS